MAATPDPTRCRICGAPVEIPSAASTCSDVCGTLARDAFQAAAVELLQRQTRALTDHASPELLAALARDAARILGPIVAADQKTAAPRPAAASVLIGG